eukprot:6470412-Karenia_brevis.AAC.1
MSENPLESRKKSSTETSLSQAMEDLAGRLAALELEQQQLQQQNLSLRKKLGQRVKAETAVGVQRLAR